MLAALFTTKNTLMDIIHDDAQGKPACDFYHLVHSPTTCVQHHSYQWTESFSPTRHLGPCCTAAYRCVPLRTVEGLGIDSFAPHFLAAVAATPVLGPHGFSCTDFQKRRRGLSRLPLLFGTKTRREAVF